MLKIEFFKARTLAPLFVIGCSFVFHIRFVKVITFVFFVGLVGVKADAITLPKVWPTRPSGAPVEVVYPREPDSTGKFPLRSGIDSTFLLGNVSDPVHTKLTINSHPVEVDSGGGWIAWLRCPSKHDDFIWHIQATTNLQVYKLEVPVGRFRSTPPLFIKNFPQPFWVTTKEGARMRNSPQGKNILLPVVNTPLRIHAQIDAAYGCHLPDGSTAWVDTNRVSPIKLQPKLSTVKAVNVDFDGVKRESTIRFVAGAPTPFRVYWDSDTSRMRIELMLFKAFKDPATRIDTNSAVSSLHIISHGQGCYIDIVFKPNSWIIGYNFSSDENGLNLHLREAPPKSKPESMPLNGWNIVIDPGHGGTEYGAIGPTWLAEKNVNLEVATRLTALLQKFGASVKQTRVTDTTISLPDRIGQAEEWGADVLLSVHQNALPDDENPWDSTGSAVFYYHPQSEGLAQALYLSLHQQLALPERGVYVGDFAICRSQKQLAVLTESTFIIRPDQERMLHSPAFLDKQAEAIANGIVLYCKNHPNRLQ